jgi:hypothetical protein
VKATTTSTAEVIAKRKRVLEHFGIPTWSGRRKATEGDRRSPLSLYVARAKAMKLRDRTLQIRNEAGRRP